MKKKLLIFLGIFIFMIIPKNVYAMNLLPYYSTVGGVNITNTGSTFSFNITTSYGSAGLPLVVETGNSIDTPNTDYSFNTYPYVIVYFISTNPNPNSMVITRNAGCSSSCFGSDYTLKFVGNSWYNGQRYYKYGITLNVSKYYSMADDYWQVADSLQFWQIGSGSYNYIFTNIYLSQDGKVDESSVQSTDLIINNQNTNTQNVINNQNNNTQSIINNQNQNANQQHQDMQDLNDTMSSEEAPTTNDVSSKANEWSSKLAGTGPVSQMVLMPITLLNGYVSGMNATCQPYNLGSLMGTDIVLPCINVSNYLGSTLWNVIDILFSGFMIYAIGKKFVKIFNDFTNLRDNQIDDLYGGGK